MYVKHRAATMEAKIDEKKAPQARCKDDENHQEEGVRSEIEMESIADNGKGSHRQAGN